MHRQPDLFEGDLPYLEIVFSNGQGNLALFGFVSHDPDAILIRMKEVAGLIMPVDFIVSICLMQTAPVPGPPILIEKIL